MSTQPVNPSSLTQANYAQMIIENGLVPQANLETQNSLLAFNNAVATATQEGIAPPTSYTAYSVDENLVLALMGVSGTVPAGKTWNDVIVATTVTPPPPPSQTITIPAGFPIGPLQRGNQYMALDVAPLPVFPNGATFTNSQGTFVKVIVSTPFGNSQWWQLQS